MKVRQHTTILVSSISTLTFSNVHAAHIILNEEKNVMLLSCFEASVHIA